ncbi:latent-transforming growth factor beta-binding 4-like isoform X1, partial [Paramuricea clavata]
AKNKDMSCWYKARITSFCEDFQREEIIIFLFVSSSAADPSYKCHQNISSWQGNLSFPLSFRDNVNRKEEVPCVWNLSVSSGNIIKLIVTELQVGNDTNCNKSYLEIYDGDALMVKSLCWLNGSFSLLSTSSGLSIRLVVSSNDLFRTFHAHHQGICSLSVNPWSGVLSSPNYPHPYLSNQNCSWRFPDRGDGYRTIFTIKHLDLDGDSDCQKNLLTISSSTVNMVICSKSSLSLDSCSVEVKFQSKENYNKSTGFEIEYVVEGGNASHVDECTTKQHNCHKEAKCRNTVGSYVCECNMYHTGNGTFCTDIDECSFGSQVCKPHSICTNTEGAYDCECKAGFEGNGHVRCVNVDECEEDAHDCDANAKCTDTVGSYICTCAEYYTGNGTYCEDINECLHDINVCDTNAKCLNKIGSYECICDTGYTGNGENCFESVVGDTGELHHYTYITILYLLFCHHLNGVMCNCLYFPLDINECLSSIRLCYDNAKCQNIPGSFICKCDIGFTGHRYNCSDIDECSFNEDICHPNAECNNSFGSFECRCLSGYTGDGFNCTDIDECSLNKNVCHPNAKCDNTIGSFKCHCISGYTGDGCNCTDVDECSSNKDICHSDAECNNTLGSFDCCCLSGYGGNGFNCTDLDECSLNNNTCHQYAKCINSIGSFQCNCLSGYTGDGLNCSDSDECYFNTSACHSNAKCSNSIGSYRCNCDTGFTGNGFNCTDLDECTSLPKEICHENADCINMIGSYRCQCVTGFIGNGFNCTDINECCSKKKSCHPDAECMNVVGSFYCRCRHGYTGDGFNCVDLDECKMKINLCDSNARCININGSYNCQCDDGYSGDGFHCLDILNGSTYCSLEESQDVTWETTVVGDVRTHSCPNEHLGNCSRKCSDQGIWEYPDMSNCVSPKFISLDNQFHEENVAKEDVLHGSDVLSNLTSGNRTKLYGGDIIASVRILKRLVFNSNRSRLSNFSEQDIEKFTTSYSKTFTDEISSQAIDVRNFSGLVFGKSEGDYGAVSFPGSLYGENVGENGKERCSVIIFHILRLTTGFSYCFAFYLNQKFCTNSVLKLLKILKEVKPRNTSNM